MRNEVNGSVRNAVQVGTVEGDLHVHSPNMSAPVPSVQAPFGRLAHPVRGRDVLLDELDALLLRPGASRVAVLHGLGGCGKTTIALLLARRAAAEGVTVLWVGAATEAELWTGMRQVAVSLGAETAQLEQAWSGEANAADLVWRLLQGHPGRWLLVLDNADDLEAFGGVSVVGEGTGWWREEVSERGALLATSRHGGKSDWGSWSTRFQVGGLSVMDGAQVLFDLAGDVAGSRAEAESLAVRLGGLPLALRLAGSYLAEACEVPWDVNVRSYADYARALESGLAGDELVRTWDLSLDVLARRGYTKARMLLELLCHFGSSPIPVRSLLFPEVVGVDAFELWKLLIELANTGFVDLVREAEPWVHLHPLVRELGRARAREAGKTAQHLGVCVRSVAAAVELEHLESPEDPDRWPFWESVAPHSRWFVESAAESLPELAVCDIILIAAASGRYVRALGLYQQAVDDLSLVVTLCQTHLGELHPHTVNARHCRASALHAVGQYEVALVEYSEVLELRRQTIGEDDAATLPTRHQLAFVLHELGRLDEAERAFNTLLAVRRRVSGPTDVRTLNTWLRWARVLEDQGDLEAALREYQSIAAIQVERLGSQHSHTLGTLHPIAVVRLECGELVAAEVDTRFVLEARSRVLGVSHPTTLISLSQMALVHHRCGRTAEAVRDYISVLDQQVRLMGPNHPNTKITRQRLADVIASHG